MKKLYTLLAAACCIIGASAAPVNMMTVKRTDKVAELSTMQKAPAKAAPQGKWKSIGMGTYSEGLLVEDIEAIDGFVAGQTWEVEIEQSAEDANWYRTIVYNANSPVAEQIGEADTQYLCFNVADPDKAYIDIYNPYEMFYFAQYCPESFGSILADPSKVEPGVYGSFKNGVLTYDNAEALLGFYIEGTQLYYHYVNGQLSFAIALPGYEMPESYITVGKGTFHDGLFGYFDAEEDADPLPLVSQVTVQQHVSAPNFFRIPDAWNKATEGYDMNPKALVINAADVNDVSIPQQPTGVMFTDGELYIMSSGGHFNGIDYPITYKDNVIDMQAGSLAYTFPAELAEQSWYIPRPSDKYKYYGSKLELPEGAGVSAIPVSVNNNIEYYNLQGVRVANPSNGIFIVRNGDKTYKAVIR